MSLGCLSCGREEPEPRCSSCGSLLVPLRKARGSTRLVKKLVLAAGGVLLVVGLPLWVLSGPASLKVSCTAGTRGENSCTFWNLGRLPPGQRCVKHVEVTPPSPHAPTGFTDTSDPMCSGLLWPGGTRKVAMTGYSYDGCAGCKIEVVDAE